MSTPPLIPLEDAMEQFQVPEEARPLVRQIARRTGVIGCEVKASYLKAMREDGLHPLHVGKRSTEWFGSRGEAVAASDLPDRVRNKTHGTGAVNWAVDHPVPARSGASRVEKVKVYSSRAAEPREYGVCETCWQARTPSGSCGCDD